MKIICDISFKKWLSEAEACAYTTFCSDVLREARDKNQIPFRKFGRKIIYDKEDLDAFMKNLEFYKNGFVKKRKK